MEMTFEAWLEQVDEWVANYTGMGRDDLPDYCYRDWYEDGETPRQAARMAIQNANEG